MIVRFFVVGTPAVQGNHRTSRHGYTYETSKGHRPWRAAVAAEALIARQRFSAPLTAPYIVVLEFLFRRPKRPAHSWPPLDVDKCCRAACDGMQEGGLIVNDSAITELRATKAYAKVGEPSGCWIEVRCA